ncbi:MAG TPA: LuxR family transcriptional regulator [Pseudonocardia sp.]
MDMALMGEPRTAGHLSSAPPRPVADSELVGRSTELDALAAFTDDAATHGGALVLTGHAGVGRTALLDATVDRARRRGIAVLRSAGDGTWADDVPADGALACLLQPIRHEPQRRDRRRPNALSAAVAALRAAGREQALLVVVDDLQDLDQDCATALGFVARRLAGSRVGLLAAVRTEEGGATGPAGFAQLPIPPLADADAARLIRDRVPELAAHLVRRVSAEAAGNPLALRELAATTARAEPSGTPLGPVVAALSARLQERFAPRVRVLPPATRRALLVAALADDLATLLPRAVHDALEPAVRSGLLDVDRRSGTIRFRHPLMRSTVQQLATAAERRVAHRTIAQLLVDLPERRLRQLAAATVAPDERLAHLLQRAAWRVLHRGDPPGAVAMLVQASELSPDGKRRGRRLAGAACIAAHGTGDLVAAPRLLAAARRADPGHDSLSATTAQAYCLLNGDGEAADAQRLLLAGLAGRRDLGRPRPAVVEGLHVLVDVAAWAGSPELWASVRESVGHDVTERTATLHLRVRLLAEPARVAQSEAAALDCAIRGLVGEPDPLRIVRVAALGLAVDRVMECREPLRRVLDKARCGQAVTTAMAASALLCAGDVATGRWDEACELAEEGIDLCEQYGHRLAAAPLRLAQALVAAARGDEVRTRTLCDPVIGWAAPRDLRTVVAQGQRVLALAALGRGDVEGAYRCATAVTAPGRLDDGGTAALRVSMDLVEAAVRLDRRQEARLHVQAMRDAPLHAVSTRFAMLTAASAALVAEPDAAPRWFEEALGAPDAQRWPFDQARIQLAYGEYLRRQRRMGTSRVLLGAALDTFLRLSAHPWAARARHGLRATGVTVACPVEPGAVADLTPDERAAAVLAAAGLTNKQIARRLMVSHHTVAARLYQAFPKLGVGSRAALSNAILAFDHGTAGCSEVTLGGIA